MTKQQNPKIKKINYGIAGRVGNKIYINKKLLKYPKLYNSIIEHEKQHSSEYNKQDFKMEFFENFGNNGDYWDFVLSHPSSWITFLPIKKYGSSIVFNPALFGFWIVGIIFFRYLFRLLGLF